MNTSEVSVAKARSPALFPHAMFPRRSKESATRGCDTFCSIAQKIRSNTTAIAIGPHDPGWPQPA